MKSHFFEFCHYSDDNIEIYPTKLLFQSDEMENKIVLEMCLNIIYFLSSNFYRNISTYKIRLSRFSKISYMIMCEDMDQTLLLHAYLS